MAYKPIQVKRIKKTILKGIREGKSIDQMTNEKGIPSVNTVYKWLNKDAVFCEEYTHARKQQVKYYGEKIERVITELKADTEPSREKTDIARLEIDSLKWIAARMQPKVYGSNTMQNNIQINTVQPVTGMTIVDEVEGKE